MREEQKVLWTITMLGVSRQNNRKTANINERDNIW